MPGQAGLGGVRRVGGGVDTLHLFTVWAVSARWVEQLAGLKKAACEAGAPQTCEIAGIGLSCKPHGAGGAPYLLDSDLFAVKVNPGAVQASPRVSVECRALALWSLGWRKAADRAVELMREICGDVEVRVLDVQVSRLDVCVDFQGWELRPEDRELFTCRVRRRSRGAHFLEGEQRSEELIDREASRVCAVAKRLGAAKSTQERAQLLDEVAKVESPLTVSSWGDAKVFSGFSLGRGVLAARAYDKTAELAVSRKHWFREVWRKCPDFVEESPVWRLEFQLRREALIGFRDVVDTLAAGVVDEPLLGRWADCARLMPALWAYLTKGWLRHGKRTAKDRRAVSPQWAQLQQAWSNEVADVALHRPQLDCARKTVVPALAGYLATATAQVQEVRASEQPGAAPLPYWRVMLGALRAAHAYAEARNESVADKSAGRARRLAARRAVLGHRELRASGDLALAAALAEHGRKRVGVRLAEGLGAERGVDENGRGWVTYFPTLRPMTQREIGF